MRRLGALVVVGIVFGGALPEVEAGSSKTFEAKSPAPVPWTLDVNGTFGQPTCDTPWPPGEREDEGEAWKEAETLDPRESRLRGMTERFAIQPAETVVAGLGAKTRTRVNVVSDRPLSVAERGDSACTPCEPTIGHAGDKILFCGNYFASVSTNGGQDFTYLNPAQCFDPPSDQHGFCCDQVAIYDPRSELFVWNLQYVVSDRVGNTDSTVRLAVSTLAEFPTKWRLLDFSPASVDPDWTKMWFDFSDVAFGSNYLYVTVCAYGVRPCATEAYPFKWSVVLRLPLSALREEKEFRYRYYPSADQERGLRVVQGASDPMFFGATHGRVKLRVMAWAEAETDVEWHDRTLTTSWGNWPKCKDLGARVPCASSDRVTAAWASGDFVGFAWSVPRKTSNPPYPWPYVRVAVLRADTLELWAEPHLWSTAYAYSHPAATSDGAGGAAVSVCLGGGSLPPSHAVGFLLAPQGPADEWTWDLQLVKEGKAGGGRWGDYLCARRLGSSHWVATGFTQLKDGKLGVEPRYVEFGLGAEYEACPVDPCARCTPCPPLPVDRLGIESALRRLRALLRQFPE